METDNKVFEDYLRRLKTLDQRIEDGSDGEDLLIDLNQVINELSHEFQSETVKKSINPMLKFVNKSNNPDPSFAHEGDSGFDLRANLKTNIIIPPGEIRIIPTGLYFEIEKGLEIQVRSRSGLAANDTVMVLNSPGTIDSHYRGEVQIILANFSTSGYLVGNGNRIAQGVVCPVYGEGKLTIEKVEELSKTVRNEGKFGSTGTS